MAGLQGKLGQFNDLGARVIAASADTESETRALADKLGLTFPLAFGVTRDIAETIGAWWESNRGIVQPAEFIVGANGGILSSTYSSGPIGRAEPADMVALLGVFEQRRLAGA